MSEPNREARKKMDKLENEDTPANIEPGIIELHVA